MVAALGLGSSVERRGGSNPSLGTMRKIDIIAKCNDLVSTEYFVDGISKVSTDGFCPQLKGISKGDYIRISIDLDTGNIMGYDPIPHEEVMEELTDGVPLWDHEDTDEGEISHQEYMDRANDL